MIESKLLRVYYRIRPLLPYRLQIELRRRLVRMVRDKNKNAWPFDEKTGDAPPDWLGWPEGKRFAFVLTHDVETSKGHDRVRKLAELDEEFGVRSSFNFVPERYSVSKELREYLQAKGFEVGVHGLKHDGRLYATKSIFMGRAGRINEYLKKWESCGFRSPSMHHNLEWIKALNIEYDASTFDIDPFEPQPDGTGTIFPFWVEGDTARKGYVELPYTLPQDSTLFVSLQENTIDIWKKKLDWVAQKGGMAMVIVHPDYLCFGENCPSLGEYPSRYYRELLHYVKREYQGKYWHALPRDIARYWRRNMVEK